jgi:autotransporter-associated beta strand protein
VTSAISGTGTINKNGTGTTTLNSASAFTGPFTSNGGLLVLSGPLSSPFYTASSGGSLRFDGSTVNMSGTNAIQSTGGPVEYKGTIINGGSLLGQLPAAGTHTIISSSTNTQFNGVTIQNSVDLIQNSGTNFTSVTNGGRLTSNAFFFYDRGTNTTSGDIVVNNSFNTRNFTNYGQITVNSGGSLFHRLGNLASGGGSRITVNSGGLMNLMDGSQLDLNGALLVNNGTISGAVNVNFGSIAKGTGAYGVVNVHEGGVYSPGTSPGVTTASSVEFQSGTFASAGPRLDIELAGPTLGSEYDQLHVTGQLSLGGILNVSSINGFAPSAGNSFDILDWGTLSGTFSIIQLPALAGTLAWNTSQLYTSGIISVISGIPGDYTNNGAVDASDYALWRKNENTSNLLPNDPIGGTIGAAQFNTWRAHFGQPSGSGSVASGNATVPEPTTSVILILPSVGMSTLQRWRKWPLSKLNNV